MRLLVALLVVVYIVGIGVVLAPTIQAKWSAAPASSFATSVAEALPNAAAWPGTGVPECNQPRLITFD